MLELTCLHPLIVHFSVALLTVGLLAELAGLLLKRQSKMTFVKKGMLVLMLLLMPHFVSAQQSTLRLSTFYSSQLHRNIPFYILLPPGHDTNNERYPVIYMLRGAEFEWITQTQDGSRGGRELKSVVDGLYAQGKIGKMIYVMPGLTAPATIDELNAVAYQLFPHIDSVYKTIPTRWHRGVDGFSYGGLDEIEIVCIRPDAFATAGSYDGSFWAFDFNKIYTMSEASASAFGGIRFMHHSGMNQAGTTNYASVRQLVDLLAARGWKNEFAEIRLDPNAVHNWWFADEHMLVTLPIHWDTFTHAPQTIQAQFVAPAPGTRVAGQVNIQWSAAHYPVSSRTMLDYSSDRGKTWNPLFTGPATIQSFSWNTTGVQDGAWYTLRLTVVADTAFGRVQLSSPFIIDNPGNGAPAAELLSLASGDTVTGMKYVQWAASDPEGDSLTFDIDVSVDGGSSWTALATRLTGTEYLWNSQLSPNSTSAILRVRCTDGQASSEALIGGLVISNSRTPLPPSLVYHVAGGGDGRLIPHIVDSRSILQHEYQVSFRDSASRAIRFSVYDRTLGSLRISDAVVRGAGDEGPLFDGLRLEIDQPAQPTYSADSSRWLTGSSTLIPQVRVPEFVVGDKNVTGVAYPADYLVTVYDHIVDTSSSYLDAVPAPIQFRVRNVTDSRNVSVVFGDQDGNGQIGAFDEIVILEQDSVGRSIVAWDLSFAPVGNPVLPQAGDAFFLKILKPFTSKDTLRFTPVVTGITQQDRPGQPERFALYQNYPNPFNPSTRIKYTVGGTGGSGLGTSNIRLVVYDLLGREVAVLVNERKAAGSYEVQFDASRLSTGVYICRLTAGTFVQSRKMILTK